MRGLTFFEHRIQDLRFALRQLLKSPAFACTAIAMLALGIAANVAIFGFVDATLIAPLPYADQSRLVVAFGTRPGNARGLSSHLDYLDYRALDRAFSAIDAYAVRVGSTLATAAGAQRVASVKVTSGFFHTLGVTPVLGRDFRGSDEDPSAPATVMLTHAAWQTRFAGRPDVVGQAMTLDGVPKVIVGVLPWDFHFTMAATAEMWETIQRVSSSPDVPAPGASGCWQRRGCRSLQIVARLADGMSVQAAQASLASVAAHLKRQYPQSNGDQGTHVLPLREVMFGDVRPILLMLLSGAGLLLLIAGINVVSLLLARSDSRTREVAVRNALGASSPRLVLQFATEALVLVTASSAAGLIGAAWGMRFLTSLLSADMLERMPYLRGLGLNVRLVAFAGAIAVVAAVVFALTPVLRVSTTARLAAGLKEGRRGSAGATWRRFGASLVIAELAIAVILLVSAGLLGKSLYRLLHVDPGFDPRQIVTIGVSAAPGETRGVAVAQQVAARIAAVPGVQSVGYADQLPLSPGPTTVLRVVGGPDRSEYHDDYPIRRVSPAYFRTLRATLLRGRYFTDAELTSRRPVLIINQTTAQRYFPGEDPVGKRVVFGSGAGAPPPRQIVGVVADLKDETLEAAARPAAYVPFDQPSFALVVRTSQAVASIAPSLIAAIHEVRPDLVIDGGRRDMADTINRLPSASLRRALAWLAGGFAAMAFLLSVIGLYGVVAYSVGQRTREIGVRMALGAQRRSVYQLILGEAAWLVGLGTLLGTACAVAAATLMRRLLFGVQSWDAPTLGAVAAVLVVSALLASYIPARRAASVNPIEVLRAE